MLRHLYHLPDLGGMTICYLQNYTEIGRTGTIEDNFVDIFQDFMIIPKEELQKFSW